MRRAPALAVALLLAGCGGAGRPPPAEVDVSKAAWPQAEVRVVTDASDPNTLLAASNDYSGPYLRVYASSDGGASWSSVRGPTFARGCASDPAPAIGVDGREYLLFLRQRPCARDGAGDILVATRAGSTGSWSRVREVAPPVRGSNEDRPDAVADAWPHGPHRGRVYVVWTSFHGFLGEEVRVVWSDDGGRTWSAPSRADPAGGFLTEAAVGIGPAGDVYVAWVDSGQNEVEVARSGDGGRTFGAPVDVGTFLAVGGAGCPTGGTAVPAQPERCVGANPEVSVDASGRVYVTYGTIGPNRSQDVFVRAFDRRLHPESGFAAPVRIGRPDGARASDQFLVTSAVDERDGTLWACFYDTRGLPRTEARFRCSASFDGGRTWRRAVAAASAPSDETARTADRFEYGDFEGLAVARGIARPMWTDGRRDASLGEEIYTRGIAESALR